MTTKPKSSRRRNLDEEGMILFRIESDVACIADVGQTENVGNGFGVIPNLESSRKHLECSLMVGRNWAAVTFEGERGVDGNDAFE